MLITDAAYLAKPKVRAALAVLDANNGEIWAKLDAGTEEYFRTVDRPNVPLQTVLDGILDAARARPIVIQSLFMRVDGAPPPAAEIEAYIDRLNGILAAGGRLKAVQVYTIARQPAERFVAPLADADARRPRRDGARPRSCPCRSVLRRSGALTGLAARSRAVRQARARPRPVAR